MPLSTIDKVQVAYLKTYGAASSPVLLSEGRVYMAHGMSQSGRAKGGAVCFDAATLTEVWSSSFAEGVGDSELIIANGALFAGCNAGLISLDAVSGQVRWIWRSPHLVSYQEVSPLHHEGRVIIGGADGVVTSIDAHSGNEVWRTKVCNEPIFGQPCLHDGALVVCSMQGTAAWIDPADGKIHSQFMLAVQGRLLGGCFAKPILGFVGVIFATNEGNVVEMDAGGSIRNFTSGFQSFIAAPVMVGGRLLVADSRCRLVWLSESFAGIKSITLEGRFLFGRPCVSGHRVAVTTYGYEWMEPNGERVPKFSNVYVLEDGAILEAARLPITLHALAGMALDGATLFAPMTPFTQPEGQWDFAGLAKFQMNSLSDALSL